MKPVWGLSLAAAVARLSSATPIVIDQATFRANGGDLNDVAGSIRTKNEVLRSYSYNAPWLVVGQIGGCTATWLGGDAAGWTYILTAAHCVDYKGEETPINTRFTAWDGRVIASGAGTAHVPPQRVHIPPGMGGASTDIAILKLPTRAQIVGKSGLPLEPPLLYDGSEERGRDVILVGYGTWGVGTDVSGSYFPSSGERRLYARARIDSIFELDFGIGATFQPSGPSKSWARVAPGDSGSAWWQVSNNRLVIIATTNGGHSTLSTGARVSKYILWIRSVYANARLSSAAPALGCIVKVETGDRYCLPAGERSPYSLPKEFWNQQVYVDAAPGTAVTLCDWDNLSYNRLATFDGTVENDRLKAVKAANGETLDFSHPKSMRVVESKTALGCIFGLTSGDKYCLPAGQRSGYELPAWISGLDAQAQPAPGARVQLCDWANLSYNRLATFDQFTQNWELRNVTAANGQVLDFSRPRSMRVL
ncbi:peptidase S1 and S6, chymotrypsin/Hap [Cordyceps fumosorosea ARSEF 2679]|uniref:Peptidase S1 and S6, chymotrypsin/Hap n=1 Tax=Cordyceps fumosorosea (strain ARSEF 2679) TaxID=1081104 RepID=A0A168DY11_CORFA|nr:peptidase S1 and S6, chymotrypsin/Hap [Cordyceps fumosorosea ARSEF 2679]OAA73143.1 peptidase S1 and S6, chymotrypsin/Hap [Cordyceps fumosorosea ARSEF 2679]